MGRKAKSSTVQKELESSYDNFSIEKLTEEILRLLKMVEDTEENIKAEKMAAKDLIKDFQEKIRFCRGKIEFIKAEEATQALLNLGKGQN